MTTRHFDRNSKPPPPPGLPTVTQRIEALQFAALKHNGYLPKNKITTDGTSMDVRKVVLPPERALPSGKVPHTIFLTDAPTIHYDYDIDDDDDDLTNEEVSLSCNGEVFRPDPDDDDDTEEFTTGTGNAVVTGTLPRPVLRRSQAFGFLEPIDSIDEEEEIHDRSKSKKPTRPHFMSGFMAAIYAKNRGTTKSEEK